MSYVTARAPGLGQIWKGLLPNMKAIARSERVRMLAEEREAALLTATFEAQLKMTQEKAAADLQAKLADQREKADWQTRLLTVTPDAAFQPAYAAALPSGMPVLPLVIGAGVLLALYFSKK